MKDFKKAQKIIEEYRKLRLDKEAKNSFRLHEKLAKIGYTIEQFINYSNEIDIKNVFKKIKTSYCDVDTVIISISKQLSEKDNSILFNKPTKKAIYSGNNGYNKEYCEQNNISIVDIGYSGGTIVFGEKDLGISIVLDKKIEQSYLNKKIAKIINDKAVVSGNDIMIDEYKICGSGYLNKNNKHIYLYQISFDIDLDLIKNICVKEMVKIPKGLNSFSDKTREDLINEILLWLQQ